MFEPEVLRKQMYCIEEVLTALLRLFRAWGIVPPLPPSLGPSIYHQIPFKHQDYYFGICIFLHHPSFQSSAG